MRPQSVHHVGLWHAVLPRNAAAVSPVHIRLDCPSCPTVTDRYFVEAYTPCLDQSVRYRRPDRLQSTVATPVCSVRIAIPRVRPRLPPCPNRPRPPYVQSRRESRSHPRFDPSHHPTLRSRASLIAAGVPPWRTAIFGFPSCDGPDRGTIDEYTKSLCAPNAAV